MDKTPTSAKCCSTSRNAAGISASCCSARSSFGRRSIRRVVGNSGTALYGRMDADELATPGYAVLSPAVKTKLATLEKGPAHGATSAFHAADLRAVSASGDHARPRRRRAVIHRRADVDLDAAVLRSLRTLDPSLTLSWVQDAIGIREDDEIIRARNAALRERPADVRKFFLAQLRPIVPTQPAARATDAGAPVGAARRSLRVLDPRCASRRVAGSSARYCSPIADAVAGAQSVTLQIKPKPGDTLRMRLDQQTEMTGVRRTRQRRRGDRPW